MAKSLASLRRVKADTPPLFVIYGEEKLGKTTFASEWPDPVFIQCEQGTPGGVDIPSFGKIKTFEEVLECIGSLLTEKHSYKTLVVDTLDRLEKLIHKSVCQVNQWVSIETPDYGKGFVAADEPWQLFRDECREVTQAGIAVVLISHYKQITIKSPITDHYSKYVLSIHDRACSIIKDEADVIGFINKPFIVKDKETISKKRAPIGRAVGSGGRIIDFEGAANFLGGNRYGMPSQIEYRIGEGYSAVSSYFPQPTGIGAAVQQAAE